MKFSALVAATLRDSHFLIPLAVFCVGLALLIAVH
ncbi:MAG TPA: translocated intimin receptor Tir [Terracidiphilus sp.]